MWYTVWLLKNKNKYVFIYIYSARWWWKNREIIFIIIDVSICLIFFAKIYILRRDSFSACFWDTQIYLLNRKNNRLNWESNLSLHDLDLAILVDENKWLQNIYWIMEQLFQINGEIQKSLIIRYYSSFLNYFFIYNLQFAILGYLGQIYFIRWGLNQRIFIHASLIHQQSSKNSFLFIFKVNQNRWF